MLAWTATPGTRGGVTLDEVPEPAPQADELLVQVEAFAPNPGDLAALAGAPAGTVPGWDGSGTVLEAAADGLGPQPGERVLFLGLAARGWAQRRAVPRALTALAPAGAGFEHLSTLPVPATSALRAVRRLGSVLGRRVLIVGGTSAVGRFAVQLAARSGAEVVAVARDGSRHAELRALGAAEVHAELATVTRPVHGAIDMIGGQHLVDAYALLAQGGTVVALGHAAGTGEHFPYGAFVADPATSDRTITSFFLGTEPDVALDMAVLARGVAESTLDVGALRVEPWTALDSWIEAGGPRRRGRPVFRVGHEGGAGRGALTG